MRLTDAEYCARARISMAQANAHGGRPDIPGPDNPAEQQIYRERDQQTSRLMGTLIGSAVVSTIFFPFGPAALLFGAMGGIIVHEFIKNRQDY